MERFAINLDTVIESDKHFALSTITITFATMGDITIDDS